VTVLAQLWRDHRAALLAFLTALAITLFFAVRFLSFALYWSDPAHRNQVPEAWMTPGYVARSWHIPREAFLRALDLPPKSDPPRSFEDIAKDRGIPVTTLLGEVAAAITALRGPAKPE
jgi:hypothetical protein